MLTSHKQIEDVRKANDNELSFIDATCEVWIFNSFFREYNFNKELGLKFFSPLYIYICWIFDFN